MAADPDVDGLREHYALGIERDRLQEPNGVLEFERTKEVVLRHLPPPPASVADIGGGPGAYADWLVNLGYRVVHRDMVELHVEQTRNIVAGRGIDTRVGDARSLDLDECSVDAVLLLGPLYHLRLRRDRLQALSEAYRVLRPGGYVFAAAISRWAARIDGVTRARLYRVLPEIRQQIVSMERTGWMPPLYPGSFCGYAHRPHQLRSEIKSAGFDVVSLVALEGPAVYFNDLDARMADPEDREVVLETARALESIPELAGIGSHLLATARRS